VGSVVAAVCCCRSAWLTLNTPATVRDGATGAAVDVMRPPPDDLVVCGQQKIVRWPLASA
jgi:hypothetical protein